MPDDPNVSSDFSAPAFMVTGDRTKPSIDLDNLTLVASTGRVPRSRLTGHHARVLDLAQLPIVIAEIAARMGRQAFVARVLVADLIHINALAIESSPELGDLDEPDLERLLDGLKRLGAPQ